MGIWDDFTSRISNYKEGPVTPLQKFDFKCSCGRTPKLTLEARNELFLTVQCECGKGETVSVA